VATPQRILNYYYFVAIYHNATNDVQSAPGPLLLGANRVVRVPDDVSTGQIQQSAATVAEQVTVAGQPPASVMLPAGIESI